jgi:hypothetical protein
MKKLVGVAVGLILGFVYLSAQPIPLSIYDIQFTTDPAGTSPHLGDSVITTGIVTGIYGNNFFIEERPGGAWHGIYVYRSSTSTPALSVGDSVEVTGLVNEYNNMTEIMATASGAVVVLASGLPLPDTTLITIPQLNMEDFEGSLVRIDSVYFVESGTFSSTVYHIVSSNNVDTGLVYIKSQTNIPGTSIPTGFCDLIGNVAQWYSSMELWPRSTDDIIAYENLSPSIAYVFRSPYTPDSLQGVLFESNITDVDGIVVTTLLYYSTDGVSWNSLTPDSSSGDLYYFSIPAQSNGTTVLYYVYAEDNLGASSQTDTFSYIVASVPPIKINEVLYDAASGQTEPYAEWVELYNAGDTPVDLSGWIFADDPDPYNPSGLYDGAFTIPSGTTLGPGEFLILAYDADTFNFYWPDHGTAQVIAYGLDASSIYLGNGGSDIHIFDAQGIPVDVMWYASAGDLYYMGHSAPDVYGGHSLMRIPDGEDTDDPSLDFFDSDTLNPTPGTTNQPTLCICGDMNGDSFVNMADLSYLAAYLFFGGPPPVDLNCADVNGDGFVNMADLSYLAAYLFFGGATPNCP